MPPVIERLEAMSHVAPKRASSVVSRPRVAATLPDVASAGWVPPLLVALATVLLVVLAYSARPLVRVDLGDYTDSPFIDGFHAREVDAIAAPQTLEWPVGQKTMTVPGGRDGLWLITLYAADGAPDDALDARYFAVTGNDTYLSIPRRTDRSATAVLPPAMAREPSITLRLAPALRGNEPPATGTIARIEIAPARTYRWSQGDATISLPGLGPGAWLVTLNAVVYHPDSSPLNATLSANGRTLLTLPERNTPQQIAVLVPADLMGSGDLTLHLQSAVFTDPRPLGVLLQDVTVAPVGPRPWLPPGMGLLYALIIGLGLYACLWWMLRLPWLALAATLIALAAGAWFLAWARFPSAFMLPRLAALTVWSIVLLLVLERAVAWLFRRAGVPLSNGALRALLLVCFAGYWIKAGGMVYPYFVGIDMGWQINKVRDILYGGAFWQYYGINSPLNESTMPTAEWGANRPVIPYSPWFHIFATSFALVPLPMVLVGHMFSALVDVSKVFLIGLLGRKAGLGERGAVLAALLYAITPATFLLHSWGNIPTTFGMWWTLLSTTFIVVAYRRLARPGPFVALVALLTITFLIYTVMAVFMGVFLVLLILVLLVRPPENERRPVWALLGATVAAVVLSMLIYYGQYLVPIWQRTVPYFLGGGPASQGATAVQQESFWTYLANYWPRMSYFNLRTNAYGMQISLLVGLVGMFLVPSRFMRKVFACWLVVAVLFLVAGSRISMVDKHLFYLLPALAIGCGFVAERLWRSGWIGRIGVWGIYAMTFAAALLVWINRIATVRQ